jgi:hypothetical protein
MYCCGHYLLTGPKRLKAIALVTVLLLFLKKYSEWKNSANPIFKKEMQ